MIKLDGKRKKLKSKAKIIQKYSKDGLVEHNFLENATRNISQKIEDVNLEKTLKRKKVESINYSRDRGNNKFTRKKSKAQIGKTQEDSMIPNNSNVIHKDNEYGLADDISISELNEEAIEAIDEEQTQGEGDIENSYIETIKQDKYDPSRKQRNNYSPRHYSESKQYENINNTHLPIDRIEDAIGNKLNHKKEYILGHKGRYKHKESSTKQDLKFSKDNLDISKDNPEEKMNFQNKMKLELQTEKEAHKPLGTKEYGKQGEKDSKNNYIKIEKPLEKIERIEKGYKDKKKADDKKQGTKTQSRLQFDRKNKKNKLLHNADNVDNPIKKVLATSGQIIDISSSKAFHNKMEEVEDENVGAESIHKSQEFAEGTLRKGKNYSIRRKNRKLKRKHKEIKKVEELKGELEFNKTISKNEVYQEANGFGRYIQKWRIKRQYNQNTHRTLHQRFLQGIKGSLDRVKEITKRANKKAGIYVIALVFLFVMIMVTTQSCSNIIMGGLGTIAGTSYQASDIEVTAAVVEYTRLETGLLMTLKDIEKDHPGYDEYRYNLDGVGHDPHELLAYLTAKYGDFKADRIKNEIKRIFNEQYELTLKEIYEIEDDDEMRILVTTLSTRALSEVLEENLNIEEKELYDVLMNSKGNFMVYQSPIEGDWKKSISSLFGWRIHPIKQVPSFHTGLDIAKPEGSPLYAIFDGIVKKIDYDRNGYGHYIIIEDKSGNTALYAHCSSIDVSRGTNIKKGDIIAKVGSTGMSTGAHLHLELEDSKGNILNPYFYLYSESGSPIGATVYYNGYTGNYGNPGIPYDDETIRALFNEADKHLGKRYIFGASGPENFDCSSFVCWVFRNSGIHNIARITAQGIFNISTPISSSEAKAGDVIFFTGTYNAGVPVTHVGIYAGNGMMIHAGDPVQYTSIESNYWRNHFYSFGRLR